MSKQPSSSGGRKWNLIIDVAKSVHANNCVLAAKDEYVGNDFPGYSAPVPEEGGDLFTVTRKVRGQSPVVDVTYLLKTCNHCDNSPCKKVGGDAVIKREDGIMMIDPVKAKGRKDIYKACPYGALIWNEELQLPQNWTFDAHLLDAGWPHPRCVDVSPINAVEAVKITDAEMQKRAEEEGLEVLRPELGTKPRVYYKNMYRFNACFIGGTILGMVNGVQECIEGATIDLYLGEEKVGSAESDEFGEFRIDRLKENSGTYKIVATHDGVGKVSAEAELGESVYLGELVLA